MLALSLWLCPRIERQQPTKTIGGKFQLLIQIFLNSFVRMLLGDLTKRDLGIMSDLEN